MTDLLLAVAGLAVLVGAFFAIDWLLDRRLRRRLTGGGTETYDDGHRGRDARVNGAHVHSQGQQGTGATYM